MDKKEEKIMEEMNPMDFVQALVILHKIRDMFDMLGCFEEVVDAFDKVFWWVDEMVLLINKIGGRYHG